MLETHNLSAGYGKLQVLHNVSFKITPGKISVLMGPNGAGKSTLLKTLYGLVRATQGEIKYKGQSLSSVSTYQLHKMGIAYLPQGRINFDSLTVEDNLLMGAHFLKDREIVKERLLRVYEKFPVLQVKKHTMAYKLSGGQQQVLAIGRAVISMPKLVLMDEPSLGLSPGLIKQVFADIQKINQSFGITFLIIEHNIRSVLDVADYGFVMNSGRIVFQSDIEHFENSEVLQKVIMGEYE